MHNNNMITVYVVINRQMIKFTKILRTTGHYQKYTKLMMASWIHALLSKILFSKFLTADFFENFVN